MASPSHVASPRAVHRALADESRFRIVTLLRASGRALDVGEIAAGVGLHRNTVRDHLNLLAGAHLVRRHTEERTRAGRPRTFYASKPHLTDAPYLIAIFEQPWERDEHGDKQANYYVRESVGIALGFLLASLHTAGLATLPYAPAPMRFLNGILGRPDSERPFLIVAVGYPAADAQVPALPRKPPNETVEFI
jgi:DNA-binding transcriptional ArsR family regulator